MKISPSTSVNKDHPSLDLFWKLQNQTELQEAVIKVKAEDLPIIDESKYYQGLREIRKDGAIELHFMTFSLERLARWYLPYRI